MLLHNRGTRNTLPCNTSRALLALLLLLPGPLLAQAPIIEGNCNSGASATLHSGDWGQGHTVDCNTRYSITLGSDVGINAGADVSLVSGIIRITAPVTIGPGAKFHARAVAGVLRRVNASGITDCFSGYYAYPLSGGECGLVYFPNQDAEQRLDNFANNFARIASTTCVRDSTTGLMWEGKINDRYHLSYWDDTFAWYNPNAAINGGQAGQENISNRCYGFQNDEPHTYCNTHALVERVNRRGLCGYKDWRLPTVKELESLLSFNRIEALACLDPRASLAALSDSVGDFYRDQEITDTMIRSFWSATPSSSHPGDAWFVDFVTGESRTGYKSNRRNIRLVRGGR